jgi:methionyl-tRNA formyltransferase
MILSSEIDIDSNENAGHLRPFNASGQRDRYKYFRAHRKGNVITTIQKDASEIKSAFKLNKENCKIDWTKSALEINNQRLEPTRSGAFFQTKLKNGL